MVTAQLRFAVGRVAVALLVPVFVLSAAAGAEEDPHAELVWEGPGTCLECHGDEAIQVHGSVMYQWQGEAPDMVHGPDRQGKISGAVNSYCINIMGNWNACGSCHVGLGLQPDAEPTQEQLLNIDCMMCHQEAYRRVKVGGVFVPDEAAMAISMDEAARTVHEPTRFNCLQCHAKAGGGDAVKRGDLSLAHADTVDSDFDVHMSTEGADLACQDCHITDDHRVAGRGSDLRPTDNPTIVECANCHQDMVTGHNSTIDRHVARVACQTCHIPVYAKNAGDSAATEATEVDRTWLGTHSEAAPYHPITTRSNDLTPRYRFWNRKSRNYLLHDQAVIDPATGRYPTSRPMGSVDDEGSKLYPFKYKIAEQPMATSTGKLIALDTSVFFANADGAAATEQGLVNMGMDSATAYEWVETDTFQLLNHEVGGEDDALRCDDCHGATTRMDLEGELGYHLKAAEMTVCTQCHGWEGSMGFESVHNKHVSDKDYDCSWCHDFSRPERNLTMPPPEEIDWVFQDDFESGDLSSWGD